MPPPGQFPHPPLGESGLLSAEQLRTLLQRALRLPSLPDELLPVLQQQPQRSADLLAECFEQSERIDERERVVELAAGLGTVALERLEERWSKGTPEEALRSVGLLTRLAPDFLQRYLLARLGRWDHRRQDVAVKAIACSGSRERARLLQLLAEHVHPYVLPGVLDEIGSASETYSVPWLMRLAAGEALQAADLYNRVKAIEALGRIGTWAAVLLLVQLVETRHLWRWEHPREVRLCALQSLAKIDPHRAKHLAAMAGLPERELSLTPLDRQQAPERVRQRRYPRFRLLQPMPMSFSWLPGTARLAAEVLSLAGGFARFAPPTEKKQARAVEKIPFGTTAAVEFHTLLRRVRATAVVRNAQPTGVGFELVAIDLNSRSRMRQLLATLQPQTS